MSKTHHEINIFHLDRKCFVMMHFIKFSFQFNCNFNIRLFTFLIENASGWIKQTIFPKIFPLVFWEEKC
jgi:hypothetical protein